MKYLDRFTVKIKVLLGHGVRVVRPGFFRYRSFAVAGAHPVQNGIKSNDKNAGLRGSADVQGPADLCEALVASYVIASLVRIDNVGDLTVR